MNMRVAGMSQAALEQFAMRACRSVGLKGTVNILITGNREMQALNRRFRRKNQPTDVLSFPPPVPSSSFAGDIAISSEMASTNARKLRHSSADEVRILVLHGVLHLAGFDHEADRGEMEIKELELRKRFRLPIGLIERSEPVSKRERAPIGT